MGKFLRTLSVIALLLSSFSSNAQITIGTVDAGPYGYGSSITVPLIFTGNQSQLPINNIFELFLSDNAGNFIPGALPIGIFNGFYNPFINGTIPNLPDGDGYKLRVRLRNPLNNPAEAFIDVPGTIKIRAAANLPVVLTPVNPAYSLGGDNLGFCPPEAGAGKGLTLRHNVTAPSTIQVTITNIATGVSTILTENAQGFPISNLALGSYTVTAVSSTTSGGEVIKSVKTYVLHNTGLAVNIQDNGGLNRGCLDGLGGSAAISFEVVLSGVSDNYPGTIYKMDWGDGRTDEYTFAQISNASSRVYHSYTETSCGRPPIGNITNSFQATITSTSVVCGTINSTTGYAQIFLNPVARITAPLIGCVGIPMTFTNTSTGGTRANCSTQMDYTWYVDGVLQQESITNEPLVWTFTAGPHSVRLVASNGVGVCQPSEATWNVCIQTVPTASFTLPGTAPVTICANTTLTPTNTSDFGTSCTPNKAFLWTVGVISGGGPVTFAGGTSLTSENPQFIFTTPGVYELSVAITNSTCVVTPSAKQRVVVNTTPSATLSPDVSLCSTGTYSFSNLIPSSPTYTTLSGTSEDLPGTYTWTVSGNATIAGGPNAKYPDITFNDFGTYTVTLVHTNNCGTTQVQTQVITFIPSPIITLPTNIPICYADNVSLNAAISGDFLRTEWVGGTDQPGFDRASRTTIYTPTAAERIARTVILTLRVFTELADPCRIIEKSVVININPQITITSSPQISNCSGNTINYAITSNTSPTTYSWTAQSANVSGATAGSGSTITDQLTLTDPVTAGTVTYTITPTNNGCVGDPLQLVVNVTPVPVLTAVPQNAIICNNQSVAIGLTSNLPGTGSTLYTWTSTVSNLIVKGNTSNSTPAAITQIADVLTNLGTTDETVTYVITPYSANGCPGDPKTVIVTIKSAGVIANAGLDQFLCNEPGATLHGNAPLPGNTGQWSPVAGIIFGNISSPTTTVSGLIAGRNYVFTWTINGVDGCPGTEDDVTIVNYNPLTNTISSQSTVVCYGQVITITGEVPTGGNGTYTYSWESSADGTTWDVINGQTGKDLSYTLLGTLSFRRKVTSSTCSQFSNIITVIAQPPISNNNIAANQEICSGVVPAPLTGTQPTGSDGNFNYQWQSSTNGTTWTNISLAVFQAYAPAALTITTYYRRVVSTVTCNGGLASISLPVTITVKPDAKAEFTYTTDRACAPFVITAQNVKAVPYADRNGTYTWFANNVPIGTGINFPGYTITNSNELVDIKLVVTSSLGCSQAEFTHTFGTIQNVVPAFTQSTAEGCGPLVVNFVNTSASLVNATFRWDFGNGTTSSQVMPGPVTFLSDPTGKDITYTVTLTATTACGVNSVTSTVFVKSKPIAIFSPSKTVGCSPMTVTFSNTSPGETNTYYYDFGDGTLLTKTDKSAVQHTFITGAVTDFVVRMRAVNECGTDESSYTIRVSPNTVLPELVVNANEREGCAPFKVNFYNNSKGANSFKYTFGDGSTVLTTSAPEVVAHTFTTPGTYTITLHASNGCSDTTTTETITVLPQPLAAFTADITLGCPGLPVQFKNTTTDGVAYLWDFGDGTTSTEFEPKHIFTGAQEYYTVSLTATNNLGCTYTATRNQYIHIVPPPVAKFNVNPSTQISIPNYTFRFEDESTNNPTIWLWDFGDGTTSALQNPSHTYPDTGSYVVNLRVTNQQGCFTTTFKTVTIVGVPGYLYVPNSFIPGSAFPELREFRAKGSGIKSWKMSIFNKWGQVLWETTKLEEGRPAEGWDGVFQATPVPQGVYFWKIDVEFVNGAAWKGMTYDSSPPKKTGPIHLIR